MAGRKSIPPKALTFAQTPGIADPTLQRAFDVVNRAIQDLQARRRLEEFTSTDAGYVPASGGSATHFLAADGTWKSIVGSGAVDSVTAGSSMVTVSPTTGAVVVNVAPANFTGIPEAGVSGLVADLAARPTGSGTNNKVPKWSGTTALVDSSVTDDGTTFSVGASKLTVAEATGNTLIAGTLTLSPMTLGSVPFFGTAGLVLQNNGSFYWDNNNIRLGIGAGIAASPTNPLTVKGAGTSDMVSIQNTTSTQWSTYVARDNGGTVRTAWGYGNSLSTDTPRASKAHWWAESGTDFVIMAGGSIPGTQLVYIVNANGNFNIGGTAGDPGVKLRVEGSTTFGSVTTDVHTISGRLALTSAVGNTSAITASMTPVASTTNLMACGVFTSNGTFNTTSTALSEVAVAGIATAARSGGASNLTNIAGYFTASGAQVNVGVYTIDGTNYLNTASGSTGIGYTLGASLPSTFSVTGSGTFTTTLDVTGNFKVNTNKFQVTAASGNTLIAGTLGVTGTATFTGDVAIQGGAAIGDASGDAHTLTGTLTANGVAGSNGNVLTLVGGLPKWSAPSSGIADGSYGDVTVSGSGTVMTIATYAGSTKGLVPPGAGSTTKFLREDGAWAPTGGGGATLADGDYGDVVVSGTGTVMTIDTGVVTYAKMQNVSATSRFLGRITAGAGSTEELTGTQATSLLDAVTTSVKGLVPTAPNDATKYLDGTGAWSVPQNNTYVNTTKTSDTFNRVNSTTSLGTTDGANALDPLTWVQNSGTWGINTNASYVVTTGAGTFINYAYVALPAGSQNMFVQATLSTLQTTNACSLGVAIGQDNNNFVNVIANRSGAGAFKYFMQKCVAGTYSTIFGITDSGVGAPTPTVNDVVRLERVQYCIYKAYVNGTLVAVLPLGDNCTYVSTVRCGITDVTAGGVTSGGRLDNFSAGTIT